MNLAIYSQFNAFSQFSNTDKALSSSNIEKLEFLWSMKDVMIRTIIIEDEYQPREVLVNKLQEHCPMIDIIGFAENIHEGYRLCQELNPDLVFLDITMPNGTGFDFIKLFNKIPFEIVFCTAHPEFALEAFKISAIGYLLKPVNNDELINVVEQVKTNHLIKNTFLKYQTFMNHVNQGNLGNSNNIIIPCTDKYEVIKISDIIYLEGSEKYTFIYSHEGRKILSSQNIGKYKNILAPYNFFVNHKSYIVNLDYVKTITHEDELILTNGSRLPIARRRKSELLEILGIKG